MKRALCQLPLTVFAGLCCWTSGPAWAQAPASTGPAPAPKTVTAPAPETAAPADCPAGEIVEGKPPGHGRPFQHLAETRPVKTAVHEELHKHGLGCWASHNTVGCMSLWSEITWIFGSCRTWFGEPCPPPPGPQGYPGAYPGQGYPRQGCGPGGCSW
jgi:hypothetical protein